ncbi:AP2/ERF and B3 domain-containing transcription factor At1g51120-like [Hibiscus syriacus]|uniref:AP2/ERF and B3 domain-containing transcription factor At1g51120-like n=1 Tax=Hibiscus syriacus TaxID=106335 RepID=UPI0019244F6C|nr:AP2/ERF and B3 domain-containing transcription factor At1g51120-like [Hibiscus syriacus]
MIKDKTYSSNFTTFLAHQARKAVPGGLINANWLSYKMLFQQQLTQTDVINTNGFYIPKEYALQYFPTLGNSSGNGAQTGSDTIDVTFYDKYYVSWTFRYSYSGSIQAFRFKKGWRNFVKMKNLNSGDTVILYGCCYADQAGQIGVFYMIGIHRNVPENYIVGKGREQGFGSYVEGTE